MLGGAPLLLLAPLAPLSLRCPYKLLTCYFDFYLSFRLLFYPLITDEKPVIMSFRPRGGRETAISEGDKVTLKCATSMLWPPEEIKFFVDGKPVSNSPFQSRYRTKCEKLVIYSVKYPEDNTTFSCKAQNKYGYHLRNTTLNVLGRCVINSIAAVISFWMD